MLNAVGQLYTQGVEIDWEDYDKPYLRQKVLLPTYPFQRERYWVSSSLNRRHSIDNVHSFLGAKVSETFNQDTVFENCDVKHSFEHFRGC